LGEVLANSDNATVRISRVGLLQFKIRNVSKQLCKEGYCAGSKSKKLVTPFLSTSNPTMVLECLLCCNMSGILSVTKTGELFSVSKRFTGFEFWLFFGEKYSTTQLTSNSQSESGLSA